MPFAKRVVEPQLLYRRPVPNEEALLPPFEDLVSVSNVALSRTLRQLSDLAKHACSVFQELEGELASTSLRVRGLQGRIGRIQQDCDELDPKQEAVPVSNLDVESKLTSHYRAPWLKQRNILHPTTRPACIVDLHRQASISLWTLHRGQQMRRSACSERRVTISVSVPPSPTYPPAHIALATFESTRSSSPTECCRFSPWSRKAAAPSDPDGSDTAVALGHRPRFPVPNVPSTLDKQTNWSRALPLPTPEERMKTSSQVVSSCVIPINVTGVGFDRDASVRGSLVHSQSLLQRRRKLRRRRTVAGVPRQVHQDLDSDESPGSRDRTVIVHTRSSISPSTEELAGHLGTRDSGCQTEDFFISGAPSRRRIRSQRVQGVSLSLSHSAGNILCLPEGSDAMFNASVGARLRTRSLPRDGTRMMVGRRHDSDEEEEEEELLPFGTEDFLPGPGDLDLKDEEESMDAMSQHQLGLSESPERGWIGRTRSQLPRKADMGSCEISSSSDTFSSPVHSVSAAGVLGGQMDHKEDHQSSSGNWSGSSSTCPSQTSETIPPAASPLLTGSSHFDSELSLNAIAHSNDDHDGFTLDHYPGLRTQRAGSFSSTAMDILEEAGVGAPVEGDWSYPPRSQDLSLEPSREASSSLGCPSYTSMATCESSFSDKPPSEKADTVSHYSVDTEGYYTSMHFDCGIKGSRSFSYGCASPGSDCDFGGHMTLGRRYLSLRKPKAKPSPPQRSSSLRKLCSEGLAPDDDEEPKRSCRPLLPSRDRKLHLVLSDPPSQVVSSLEVWGAEGSTDLPDLGAFSSTDAHSFKDEGMVQADYADLWLLNDLKASDPYRSLSNSSTATGTTVIECVKSQESSESQTSGSGSGSTTPSLPSVDGDFKLTRSPERLAGLASPSSGYSSQSETPTSSFPAAFFPGPMSPSGGKRKPKVPERKSSLSSLSSSVAAARGQLELPVIPPPHLDLSALHTVGDLPFRTQIKQKPLVLPKPAAPLHLETFNAHHMTITPMVLHSVQLRSISEDKTTSKCPPGNLASTLSCGEPASPHQHHTPPKGSRESEFTSNGELADGEAVFRSKTRTTQDQEDLAVDVPERTRQAAEPAESSGDSEALQQQRPDQEEEEPEQGPPPPPVQHSSPKRSVNGLEEVLAAVGKSEEVSPGSPIRDDGSKEVEFESPGDCGSQEDRRDESTSEDSFSKDSPPGDDAASPLSDESRPEDNAVFLSPTKTRTTEDLFAMIHRSKRKVLGRKDSNELNVRNRLSGASGNTPPSSTGSSPASPAPPSSPAVTSPGLHRVSGPIYRSAKKSSTSNEEFKLLLLKKGSRSESSYRMSAAEILKSPVAPKSPGDSLTDSPRPAEEPASPLQPQRDQQPGPPDQLPGLYPKANADGFSPKSFPSPAATRPGRSRIPPPANSSRYGARGRLYPIPMQAISEGETENSDGSPHDDRSSQGSM